jgi:hypothetical protein
MYQEEKAIRLEYRGIVNKKPQENYGNRPGQLEETFEFQMIFN